ncbi:tetratricopeptide repeat protein [bacterium]
MLKKMRRYLNAYKYFKLLLFVLIFAAYSQSINNSFISLDDNNYIVENPVVQKINLKNIKTIFTTSFDGHYHPLLLLSFAVNYKISGLDPKLYIVTNILIHFINCIFVFYLFLLLTKKRYIAYFISLVFALHPMNVESVAWISSRKNLLYAFFYLPALICYIKSLNKNDELKNFYAAMVYVCFVFSLLSKAQAITLPVILVCIDLFKYKRLSLIKNIKNKVSLFAISFVGLVMIYFAQKDTGYLVSPLKNDTFIARILYASYAYIQYVFKWVFPVNLSPIYLYPGAEFENTSMYLYFYLISTFLLLYLCFYFYKKNKNIFFGIIFFTVNIFMMLKFLPVSYFVMADRYIYIASLGITFVFGYWFNELLRKNKSKKKLINIIFVGIVCLLMVMTFLRANIWQNSIVFWSNVINKNPNFAGAYNDRGLAYYEQGRNELAINDYNKAITIDPKFYRAYTNLGNVHLAQKDVLSANLAYQLAIFHNPYNPAAYYFRGNLFNRTRQFEDAINSFNEAIKIAPNKYEPYKSRAFSKFWLKDYDGAIEDYTKAIEIAGDSKELYYQRASTYIYKNMAVEAYEDLDKAIEIDPDFGDAYYKRALVLMAMKQSYRAYMDLKKAEELKVPEAKEMLELYFTKLDK